MVPLEEMKQIRFLEDLSDDHLRQLASIADLQVVPAKAVVFREGQTCSHRPSSSSRGTWPWKSTCPGAKIGRAADDRCRGTAGLEFCPGYGADDSYGPMPHAQSFAGAQRDAARPP